MIFFIEFLLGPGFILLLVLSRENYFSINLGGGGFKMPVFQDLLKWGSTREATHLTHEAKIMLNCFPLIYLLYVSIFLSFFFLAFSCPCCLVFQFTEADCSFCFLI